MKENKKQKNKKTQKNKNYNCSRPPAFKVKEKVDWQCSEKLLHHYQHAKKSFNQSAQFIKST